MIYDIRGNKEKDITEIKYDDFDDYLVKNNIYLKINEVGRGEVALVAWKDFDNFIAACHKAKELWGPKE